MGEKCMLKQVKNICTIKKLSDMHQNAICSLKKGFKNGNNR